MNARKRILIINVNWVGDVLFSTPFIRAIRQAYPESYMACLVHPRTREMLAMNPRLDKIIEYDEEGRHRSFVGKIRLINILRKEHFDTAFILHRSFTKALLAYLSKIRERIGYPTKGRSFLLTRTAEEPSYDTHKVEYFLNLARAIGVIPKDRSYEFFINNADRDFIKAFLRQGGVTDDDILVVLCPGGNWDPKRWAKDKFAKLADSIIEKFGAKVVISGAEKDLKLAEEIRHRMKKTPTISCGNTSLTQLGALLERADLVIANDTGPMHMAVSMKTPVVALFGPTSPTITGPYGDGGYRVIFKNETCDVPCYDFSCKDYRCMVAISVEDVLREAENILA